MNPKRLKELLERGESENIEFKREVGLGSKRGKTKFVRAILALANSPTSPGYLIVGIDDKTKEWVGCYSIEEEQIQQIVEEYCKPPIIFSYRIVQLDDIPFGVVEIPGSKRKPHTVKKTMGFGEPNGRSYEISDKQVFIRRGSVIGEATPEEIIEMAQDTDPVAEMVEQLLYETSRVREELEDTALSLRYAVNYGWGIQDGEIFDELAQEVFAGILVGGIIGALLNFGFLSSPLGGCIVGLLVGLVLRGMRVPRLGALRSAVIGLFTGGMTSAAMLLDPLEMMSLFEQTFTNSRVTANIVGGMSLGILGAILTSFLYGQLRNAAR